MEHFQPVLYSFKKDTLKIADKWQLEMHKFVEDTMGSSPGITYQDATNLFLLLKIAEREAIRHNEIIANDLWESRNQKI